jgi:hypothetical protein
LILKAFLHGKHPHPTHFVRNTKNKKTNSNRTPKTMMSSHGRKELARGEKLGRRPEGDQIEHLWGWTTSLIEAN